MLTDLDWLGPNVNERKHEDPEAEGVIGKHRSGSVRLATRIQKGYRPKMTKRSKRNEKRSNAAVVIDEQAVRWIMKVTLPLVCTAFFELASVLSRLRRTDL